MSLAKLAMLYVITTVAFFLVDLVWLSTATKRIYEPYIGHLLSSSPKLVVAAGFYLLYVVGVLALASIPGLREGALTGALWRGALLGLLAYGTYDLTNLATLEGWAWQVTVIDLIWGTTVTGLTAVVGYLAGRWLGVV